MDHQKFENLAAAFSLGALDSQEQKLFEEHLRGGCVRCQRVVKELNTVLAGIAAVEAIEPRPRLKKRIMEAVTAETAPDEKVPPFYFVKAAEGHWQTVAPGVTAKVLFRDNKRGTVTMLMRMEAGSVMEAHSHHGAEELFMLEGDCVCAGVPLSPGDYHRAAPGSTHNATTTVNGCLMLVICPIAA